MGGITMRGIQKHLNTSNLIINQSSIYDEEKKIVNTQPVNVHHQAQKIHNKLNIKLGFSIADVTITEFTTSDQYIKCKHTKDILILSSSILLATDENNTPNMNEIKNFKIEFGCQNKLNIQKKGEIFSVNYGNKAIYHDNITMCTINANSIKLTVTTTDKRDVRRYCD